jgi:hypothetical protein
MESRTPFSRLAGLGLVAVGLVISIAFTLLFPAVEGLGTKVRLPVFHGAMTWVNLSLFVVLAICAIAFLVTKKVSWYRWTEAVRWVAIPVWVVGSGLGLLAALNTWDFTGSKSSPLEVAAADPRLLAQFWIMVAALGILALGLLIDDPRWLAGADIAFVVFAWAVLMQAVLGPGRALHPDSPVMNSEEFYIKFMFFGIVAGFAIAAFGATLAIRRLRGATPSQAAVAS